MMHSTTLLVLILLPSISSAHPGALGKNDCHRTKLTGEYHCHKGKYADRTWRSRGEALLEMSGKITWPDKSQPQPPSTYYDELAQKCTKIEADACGEKKPGARSLSCGGQKTCLASVEEMRKDGYRPIAGPGLKNGECPIGYMRNFIKCGGGGYAWCIPPKKVYGGRFSGEVLTVSSGDTITVKRYGKGQVVRVHGSTCPKVTHAPGIEARKFVSQLLLGKIVRVDIMDKASSGIIIGYVNVNGKSLQAELFKAGLCKE